MKINKYIAKGENDSLNGVHIIGISMAQSDRRREGPVTLGWEKVRRPMLQQTWLLMSQTFVFRMSVPHTASSSHPSRHCYADINSLDPEHHIKMWKAYNSSNDSEREQNWVNFPVSNMCCKATRSQSGENSVTDTHPASMQASLTWAPAPVLSLPSWTPFKNFILSDSVKWRKKKKPACLKLFQFLRKESRILHWRVLGSEG